MKVTTSIDVRRAIVSSAVAVVLAASFAVSTPDPAAAAPRRAKNITRQQVLTRAKSWVRKRVPYSQSRYHRGYRQDCSGFVSMAWGLGRSYTTRSLPSVSRRVSIKHVRPGDAVLTPGHIVIFGGWKNKRARTFYAYHEPRSGKVATRAVRTMRAGSRILRRPGIRSMTRTAKRPVRRRPTIVTVTTAAPVASTPTVSVAAAPDETVMLSESATQVTTIAASTEGPQPVTEATP